ADFEVQITKSLALEAERKRGKFAVARHDRPHLSNRTSEIYTLPAGSRLDLHKSSTAPLPWWKRELFNNGLGGVRKSKMTVRRIKVDSAHPDANRIDSFELRGRCRGHDVCQTRCATNAQDRSQSSFFERPVET